MPVLFIGIPLLAMVALNIPHWGDRRFALRAVVAVSAAQFALAAWDAYRCLAYGGTVQSAFFGIFTVDLFSAVVLGIIGLITGLAGVMSLSVVSANRFSFGNALLLLMMGMNGAVMANDVFTLYVFIEVTASSSFLLIAINKKLDELEGAFKYYIMSALASTMILLSVALLFLQVGETTFAAIAAYIAGCGGNYPVTLPAAFVLYIAALCIKSGVTPFHTWVPDAHSAAPSPVSVMLAGVVIKVSGVYALMRIYRDVFLCDPALGRALFALGLASIFVGALGAIGQNDIKRMLAFSSVSQIGYIVLGAATGSPLGFAGAVAHFFNHATFKSLLFVDSAAIVMQTGTRDMDEMGGLGAKMPVTGVSSVLGLLSMAGIPPLSGFWSKLLIVLAVWRVSPALALAALCASILTLGYFLILQKKVFFGKLAPKMENVRECGGGLLFVQMTLSALNVAVGLLFPFILIFLQGRGFL